MGLSNLTEVFDSIKVPYLDEIRDHLPISATDKKDVDTYLKNVIDSILVNCGGRQYQFAYFGIHLLYMTYIYFSVQKISIIIPNRYKDAVVFAKPYRSHKLDFNNLESTFDYSLVSEKELPNILKIVGLDSSQIDKIGNIVDTRNNMAHASGKFEILTEDNFNVKVNAVVTSIRNIHGCMDKQLRFWFKDFLLRYCNHEFVDYGDIKDIITEQMVQGFNLSVQELLVCNEMSVKPLIVDNPKFRDDLNKFKNILKEYCKNQGYVSE